MLAHRTKGRPANDPVQAFSSEGTARRRPDTHASGPRLRYLLALLATAAAVAFRFLLAPWLDPYVPYLTIYPLVMLAALQWGKGPGILAAATGSLAANFLFMQPSFQLHVVSHTVVSFVLLVVCAAFLGHIGNRQRALAHRLTIEAEAAREAETAWRASEERLRFALETSHTGAWELNLEDLSAQRSVEHDRLFGYGQALPRWTYEMFLAHVLPEDRAAVDAAFREATATGGDWSFECRIRRIDGQVRWIWAAGRHREAAGARCLAGIVQDVTERKRAEEGLRRQATLLDSVMQTTDVMLAFLDPAFDFVWVNQRYADTCRKTVDEIVGRNHFDLYPDEGNEAIFRHVRDSGEAVFYKDRPFNFPDQPERGTSYWDWSLAPLKNESGIVSGLVFSLRETTQFKKAEEQLRRSEERFRALTTASSEIIYRMNADWTEMHQLYGRGFLADTDSATSTWLEAYVHAEDRPGFAAAVNEAIRTKSQFQLAFRVMKQDGSTGWLFSRAIPLIDPDGTISEWFGAASDITERRRAEDALREDARSKDEFLAMLAHELRNPLAPISNALHILQLPEAQSRLTGKQARDLLCMMDRQTKHLVRLVDELLDISRITRGHIELKKERVDLKAVIAHAVETSRPLIQAGNHRLQVTLPPEDLQLTADPVRMAQVFANLLNNAAKYTPPGGRIQVTAEARQGEAVVSVRDSGEGIAAPMLPYVFDLFTQADSSLDRAQGGLGIGLALVRRLVELHGGSVEARSDGPGLGSEFTVRLPLTIQVEDRVVAAASALRTAATRRILIVDDNRDAAESLARLLQSMGARAQVAYGGHEALQALPAFRPDAVLLDLGMPGMDGLETARRMRESPAGHGVTLIALTGCGQAQDRLRTREAGFDHHLVKPADPVRLMHLLISLPPPAQTPVEARPN